jgi:ATP adenylyltransferase
MEHLYAPWRSPYVKNPKDRSGQCVFCLQIESNDDAKHYIIKRYKHVTLMLNLYPYNAGHLLVVPNEHHGDLNNYDIAVRNELFEVGNQAIEALKKLQNPRGFNMGLNLGNAGGGGIPEHLHLHIIPRWPSDTNFFATIGTTRVVSVDLDECYQQLIAITKDL